VAFLNISPNTAAAAAAANNIFRAKLRGKFWFACRK